MRKKRKRKKRKKKRKRAKARRMHSFVGVGELGSKRGGG